MIALAGRATTAGTARFAARFARQAEVGHFRSALELTLSSIGVGTYLGDPTEEVDARYRQSLTEAVRLGCNVLDTAVSYRAQHSEMALGQAVADMVAAGEVSRDELVIASKGGYIPYPAGRPTNRMEYVYDNFLATGVADPTDLAGGIHCMAPNYLSQQIVWSLRNTGLHSLDIYYVHNPETQLAFVDRATFRKRLRLAFARLEEEVAAGRIGCYGVATWHGFRRAPMAADYLNLETMMQMAREVAGPDPHLRVVQFPFNALMTEAVLFRNQTVRKSPLSPLAAARQLGLTVFTSASLMQAQLLKNAPGVIAEAFPQLETDVQRALQLARSVSGVTTALVGASRPEHVRENLSLALYAPDGEKADWLVRSLPR